MDLPDSPVQVLKKLRLQKNGVSSVPHSMLPVDEVEKSIALIWSDVLRIDQVGRDDNLFRLGGDSVHAVQIIVRILRIYQIEIPIGFVFNNPTVASLAAYVRDFIESQSGTVGQYTG
jgi:acyl carrier protein